MEIYGLLRYKLSLMKYNVNIFLPQKYFPSDDMAALTAGQDGEVL